MFYFSRGNLYNTSFRSFLDSGKYTGIFQDIKQVIILFNFIANRVHSKFRRCSGWTSVYLSYLPPMCPFVPALVILHNTKVPRVPKHAQFLVILLLLFGMKTVPLENYSLSFSAQLKPAPFLLSVAAVDSSKQA